MAKQWKDIIVTSRKYPSSNVIKLVIMKRMKKIRRQYNCNIILIHRGSWGETKYCSQNMAICGVKVRMADSDTALNGAMFQCCDLPKENAYPFNLPTLPPSKGLSVPVQYSLGTRIAKSDIFTSDISGTKGKY